MTDTNIKTKNPFKFMNVNQQNHSKQFNKIVNENPKIKKKGKEINLREFINEGFECSDLMTNLKKFGNTEKIKKESAFVMLDEELLTGDYRDLLDIQKKGAEAYKTLSAIERRNMSEKDFIKEYDKHKTEMELSKNKSQNLQKEEKENVEIASK